MGARAYLNGCLPRRIQNFCIFRLLVFSPHYVSGWCSCHVQFCVDNPFGPRYFNLYFAWWWLLKSNSDFGTRSFQFFHSTDVTVPTLTVTSKGNDVFPKSTSGPLLLFPFLNDPKRPFISFFGCFSFVSFDIEDLSVDPWSALSVSLLQYSLNP